MKDILLSPHFSLAEMVHSDTATRHEMKNEPHERHIEALRHLCVKVLEPLREYMGAPIFICSGYRTPDLCVKIGSSRTSRHALGQAADIKMMKDGKLLIGDEQSDALAKAAKWLIHEHADFDGLILENPQCDGIRWLHVSYNHDRKEQRRKVQLYTGNGREGYHTMHRPEDTAGNMEGIPAAFAKVRGKKQMQFFIIDLGQSSVLSHVGNVTVI